MDTGNTYGVHLALSGSWSFWAHSVHLSQYGLSLKRLLVEENRAKYGTRNASNICGVHLTLNCRVQGPHFGIIRCTFLKMAYNSKTAGRRAKH